MPNPLLLMTEEEGISTEFCSGMSFPIICCQYAVGESSMVADQIQSVGYNPIFISGRGHKELILKLRGYPLMFTWARVWIMPLDFLPMIPLRLDNNIFFYDGNMSSGFNVYDSYAVKGMNPITTKILEWNNVEESDSKMLIRSMESRSNLTGGVLKVLNAVINPSGRAIFNHALYDLQSKMNFTIQKSMSKEKRWGAKYDNGTWNGMIGLIIDNEIDLVAGLMRNKERETVVDFCWPSDQLTITLIAPKTAVPRINIGAYVDVFPATAWIVGLVTLIVAALCFSLSSHESIVQGLTLMWRLFLQIGYDLPSRGNATRAILLTAALCFNLVFIYYSSELTADMTAEPQPLSIRSFEDVERLGYRVALKSGLGGMAYRLLRTAKNGSAMRRIYENKNFIIRQSIEELRKDIESDEKILAFSCAECLNLNALDIREAIIRDQHFAFKKDSEFTALFHHYLLKMQESGILDILHKRRGNRNQDYGMSEPIILGFDNLFFPFGCLALGIVVTVPVLLAENIGRRCKVSKQH